MRKKIFFSLIIGLMSFTLSYLFVSRNETVDLTHFNFSNRDIASISDRSNFSKKLFEDKLFRTALVNKIQVNVDSESKDKIIILTQFSSSLCQNFKNIQLIFDAYGISTSGEPTQMKISTTCLAALDPAEGAQIKVPIEFIKNKNGQPAEINNLGNKESFYFKNMDTDWNKTWILTRIIFIGAELEKNIVLNDFTNDRLDYKPIVLEF